MEGRVAGVRIQSPGCSDAQMAILWILSAGDLREGVQQVLALPQGRPLVPGVSWSGREPQGVCGQGAGPAWGDSGPMEDTGLKEEEVV